ncbi:MAG: DapH/DapD/GlmU-related protein [Methylibium sp.]|nr:DapH/DapD/GlmU-related protein [Methylibium sp.]
MILRTVRSGARIRIGAETGISGGSICAAVSVEIGSRCLLGADVLIVDTDFHAIEPIGRRTNTDWSRIGCAPVHIGDDVFIGARAIILKGVSVGAGAVIGAGSVVTRSVPEGVIVAGNPAIAVGSVDGRRRFAGSLQLHAFDS